MDGDETPFWLQKLPTEPATPEPPVPSAGSAADRAMTEVIPGLGRTPAEQPTPPSGQSLPPAEFGRPLPPAPTTGRASALARPSLPPALRRYLRPALLLLALLAAGGVLYSSLQSAPKRNPGSSTATTPLTAAASASETAKPAQDGAGNRVTYAAGNLVDGDLQTTWRVEGDGKDVRLTFTFPHPVVITSLGLTNGYTKTDPVTGTDRYKQERRILSVAWSADGRQFTQNLQDGVRTLQSMTIAPLSTTRLVLTIGATTSPGSRGADYTAISEVRFQGRG